MTRHQRPSTSYVHALLLSASVALAGCGGNVVAGPAAGGSGGGGQGGQTSAGGAGQGGAGQAGAVTSSVSAGGAGGTMDCAGLGEIACLGAYPGCVPVYDDQCCPLCDPTGFCADCSNWTFHHCATHTNGCLPEQPVECGTVPGWACVGGKAECEPSGGSKTPCATLPGCVPSYCPTDVDCDTSPVCVPARGDMCGPIVCEQVPPPCERGTTPAGENGCFSGGCIPAALCGQ